MKLYYILALIVLLTSQHLAQEKQPAVLKKCHISNYSQEVLCGSTMVYENRSSKSGREIEIHYAIMPAVTEAKEPDPLVLLAGGPGQGAMEMANFSRRAFSEIRETRDIVLIDQRGMGNSHPLKCDMPDDNFLTLTEDEIKEKMQSILKDCKQNLDADVTLYTQNLANEDIHEILQSLGYHSVNLYGVSWGTRSALLYSQQFPEHIRTIILDGSAPLSNKIALHVNEDAETAIQAMFTDCKANEACNETYPNLEQDFNTVINAFGDTGKEVTIEDANTGVPLTFKLTRAAFVGAIRNILYSPDLTRLLPVIVEQAKNNEYKALAALSSSMGDGGMTLGATLSVLCSEDIARITSNEITNQTEKGFVRDSYVNNMLDMCDSWTKAPLPKIYTQEIKSDKPTLILSGDIDPVTPPKWGELMKEHFPNSLHLIASKTGHNVAPQRCASKLMAKFVNEAGFKNVDGSCLTEIKRPSFFLSTSGPVRSKDQ